MDNGKSSNLINTSEALPHEVFSIFKRQNFRKDLGTNRALDFVAQNERFHRSSLLKRDFLEATRRFYNLSNFTPAFSSSLQFSTSSNHINYLSLSQRLKYDECLQFIEENNYPSYFSYYLLDFIAATNEKFIKYSAENIFLILARKFILNINPILHGLSSPKPKEFIYDTLPRAFSPLFMQKIQFAGSIFRNKKVPKHFENCLVHGLDEQLKSVTQRAFKSCSDEELEAISQFAVDNIENSWWVPEKLLSKFKQTTFYINNLYSGLSNFIQLLVFNYFAGKSANGMNSDALLDLTKDMVLEDIKAALENAVYSFEQEVKIPWLSASININNGFIQNKLLEAYKIFIILSGRNTKSAGNIRPSQYKHYIVSGHIYSGTYRLVSKKLKKIGLA